MKTPSRYRVQGVLEYFTLDFCVGVSLTHRVKDYHRGTTPVAAGDRTYTEVRGGEDRYLGGFIFRRSLVQIQPPQLGWLLDTQQGLTSPGPL